MCKWNFLTNAFLTFAIDIQWANNHRFHEDNPQLPSHGKNDSVLPIERHNEQLQLHENRTKEGKSTISEGVKTKQEEDIDPWNLSKDTDRMQFQIEGHEGPQTYIFGFDTGYGKSRQYRLEERHRDGTIKGQYGYYDAKGKLKKVRYVARPVEGYTEIHHESVTQKIKI
ncbi:hypothetical protein ANTPLA_LOCUS5545 [Anthophora plagiata]